MATEVQEIDFSSSLFHVSPSVMEKFCKIMDCYDGDLGWRGLAEQLSTDWMEFRKIEKYAEQGKSRTRELLWSWAQKNKTVGDLLQILQRMGHERAILLFMRQDTASLPSQNNHFKGFTDVTSKEPEGIVDAGPVYNPVLQHKESKLPSTISFNRIREGTKDFHEDLMIGEGRFFKVYKAEIQNQAYAVKLLKQEENEDKKKQWKPFLLQLEALLVCRHPNILELVGYFWENEKLCLVHPYMKNGSLLDRLQCVGNSYPLSWKMRLNILTGTARAIHYLHTARPSTVPCSIITSANILLDNQFQPKLSDFAMANQRSCTMRQSYTMKVNNDTIRVLGYLPEECIRQGTFSIKTDIYSFGVVIMETLTGYKAVLEDPDHILLKDLLMEMMEKSGIDSCLRLLDKKADACPYSMSYKLFTLALHCTSSRAKLRPTVDEVVDTLESTSQVCCFAEDLPKSLKSSSPSSFYRAQSVPVENDESQDFAFSLPNRCNESERAQKHPCECSQSEVTFLGSSRRVGSKENTDDRIKVSQPS